MTGSEKWLQYLASDKPAFRKRAAEQLLRDQNAAASSLLNILDNIADPDIRARTYEALGDHGDDIPLEVFMHGLNSTNQAENAAAAVALSKRPLPHDTSWPTLPIISVDCDASGSTDSDELVLLPDSRDVFNGDVELHRKYLIPIATLRTDQVFPEIRHDLHFIVPIEPIDGVIGEGAEQHFNWNCRKNVIGYRYEGGKCSLMTDFAFFEMHRSEMASAALEEHYLEIERRVSVQQRESRTSLPVSRMCGEAEASETVPAPEDLLFGGKASAGNWAQPTMFPMLFSDDDVRPLTEDGRPFLFVAQLSLSRLFAGPGHALADCDLLLFFDPVTDVALTTFDWT